MNNRCSDATFAVIDVETTGLDPRADRVVEVACLLMKGGIIIERFSTLINPERPIGTAASAIHGICDQDVKDAPRLESIAATLRRLTRGATIVGHNVRFDLGFLSCLNSRPSLCTLQLARRLIDAPDYRNETLRRLLGVATEVDLPPHRAATDAAVTAAVLRELLHRYERKMGNDSLQSLFDTVSRPVTLERFTFGRYRNAAISSVPTGYLKWIIAEGFDNWPDVRHTAQLELAQRRVRRW